MSAFRSVSLSKNIATISAQGNDGAVLGGAGGGFGATLISLLQARETEIPYRMDMILNIEENPARFQNDSPQKMEAAIKKVSSFAEKLEAAGLPKKLVTSGVGQGEKETVDLYFRRYEPFNPLGEKSPG